MRLGDEILNSCIGQTLRNGKFQSFVFNRIQSNKILLTFLLFENWIQIDTNDWVAVQNILESEITESPPILEDGVMNAEFPRQSIASEFSQFEQIIGKKLLKYFEIIPAPIGDPCGLLLKFSDDKYLIIYSDVNEETHFKFDNNIPDNLAIKNGL